MERAEEDRERCNISLRMNGFSRDLRHKFMNQNRFPLENQKQEEKEWEVELSLGLSMNGRFGVDPTRKKLKRSSSISNLFFTVGGDDNGSSHRARGFSFGANAPLVRTCSLPSQPEEWRHQKVLQSARSMEARKKRMEKLKNVRLVKDKDNCLEDVSNDNGLHDIVNENNDNVQMIGNGCPDMMQNGFVMQRPQGSIGSQRNGSSGLMSAIQCHQTEGVKQIAGMKSTTCINSIREQGEHHKRTVKPTNRDAMGAANELLKSATLDMPFVSTKVDGCDGNKIDGFLYRYKKGEEVRIVCVCHGLFLSPAEFVKHGGGCDVEHPLKHIIVNPSIL